MVKNRDLDITKSVDIKFGVVNEMVKAFKTELSHLGPSLNSVDRN